MDCHHRGGALALEEDVVLKVAAAASDFVAETRVAAAFVGVNRDTLSALAAGGGLAWRLGVGVGVISRGCLGKKR